MAKVQLKMPPWIASMLKAEGSGWFILEKEIGAETTIGALLAELTSSYDGFRQVVFNPDVGQVSEQVLVFLNDKLLPDLEVTQAKLSDGDSIMLLQVFSGG